MKFWASKEVVRERAETCVSCDRYIRLTGQCGECLCFVRLKVRVSNQGCPIHKWLPEPEEGAE